MTLATELAEPSAPVSLRDRARTAISRAAGPLTVLGLGWLVPLLRIAGGGDVRAELAALRAQLLVPLAGIAAFLALLAWTAPMVNTSLGAVPGPAAVWTQAAALWDDHRAERERAQAFYDR